MIYCCSLNRLISKISYGTNVNVFVWKKVCKWWPQHSDTMRKMTFAPANCVVLKSFREAISWNFYLDELSQWTSQRRPKGKYCGFCSSIWGHDPWFRAPMPSYFDAEFSEAFLAHYDVINIRRAYDYGYISCVALIIRSLRRREIFAQEIRWIWCVRGTENIWLHRSTKKQIEILLMWALSEFANR